MADITFGPELRGVFQKLDNGCGGVDKIREASIACADKAPDDADADKDENKCGIVVLIQVLLI